ncbi:hypothetical protein P8452_10962 [Trifolium repens]|nr:hypothetical protein P8452_10962 [Trifolium repens]
MKFSVPWDDIIILCNVNLVSIVNKGATLSTMSPRIKFFGEFTCNRLHSLVKNKVLKRFLIYRRSDIYCISRQFFTMQNDISRVGLVSNGYSLIL